MTQNKRYSGFFLNTHSHEYKYTLLIFSYMSLSKLHPDYMLFVANDEFVAKSWPNIGSRLSDQIWVGFLAWIGLLTITRILSRIEGEALGSPSRKINGLKTTHSSVISLNSFSLVLGLLLDFGKLSPSEERKLTRIFKNNAGFTEARAYHEVKTVHSESRFTSLWTERKNEAPASNLTPSSESQMHLVEVLLVKRHLQVCKY